ncbi:hypothetical protein GCM10020258_52880 [Sphingomonas yabuuchiae]
MKHEGHSEHQAEGLSDNPVIRDYQVANNRMHADMAIEFSGDADLDFLRGMIRTIKARSTWPASFSITAPIPK